MSVHCLWDVHLRWASAVSTPPVKPTVSASMVPLTMSCLHDDRGFVLGLPLDMSIANSNETAK